ncbi:unnamed protein product [Brassicogethes aeneus]|uniref:TAFH domain-containing protein n=1 Tax=Brassicogethes aeneus TaxID=1431903 RepID=A0A9P0ANK9_BRAAE|nr:unnamed protein product [Brassicogethes aeneus]
MASAKFLEEALSTDVDESAVSAIVGSLETQLVTSAPPAAAQTGAGALLNQNHVNGGIVAPQKHGTIANGDSISVNSTDGNKTQPNPVKIVYTQGQAVNQVMASQGGTIIPPNRLSLPNGTISLQNKQQPTLVIKTSTAQTGAAGAPGIVTVPMNVTSNMPQANNVGSPSTTQSQNILSNLQVVNVRPGVPSQQQKGQPARVVLSAPQIVGARPGAPQLTLQSFHGLQPGQQGALLLKTENGQYQLLRVGPAPQGANMTATSQPGAQPVTFRMQTVATQPQISTATSPAQVGGTTTVTSTPQTTGQAANAPQVNLKDNTKEKCRKFLANLLELSSREPKPVEKSVRTLIQELIDMRVEPEDFCDKLEKLLNASPQPCLIGFLKKSLPMLRYSLATHELTIEGIRPPPSNVVFSVAGGTPTVSPAVRPTVATQNQVRLVTPGTVVRPAGGQVLQQRLVTPLRSPAPGAARMVSAIRQQGAANVIVSSSQPPALHPVYPNNQVRQQQQHQQQQHAIQQQLHHQQQHGGFVVNQSGVRHPTMQVRTVGAAGGQVRQPVTVRAGAAGANLQAKQTAGAGHLRVGGGAKPTVPSTLNRLAQAKEKEKKTFSSAYTGDDDINDVAAMGGVNLAEESQKILGSTEFVGTKIRSCKEELMCSMVPLQQKIRQIMQMHGLDEPSADVAACLSHAAQERVKNLLEKLAIITEHRLEVVKSDQRYEVTHDVKGQLKFLEDLDKAERKKHEELEREILLRAAKSRSKTEDPEQAKLKAKAKEMQRVEMEELRQREANATALQAIGPRKKPRLDGDGSSAGSQANAGFSSGMRGQMPLRQRMKKVTLRDIQFLFESEKDLCKSKLLYRSYLK